MSNTCPSSSNMVSISFILLRRFKQAQIFVNWIYRSVVAIPHNTIHLLTLTKTHTRALVAIFIRAFAAANESNVFFLCLCEICTRWKQTAISMSTHRERDVQRWSWYEFVLMAIGDVASVLFFCANLHTILQTIEVTYIFLSYVHTERAAHMIFVTVNLLNQIRQPIKMSVCSSTLF